MKEIKLPVKDIKIFFARAKHIKRAGIIGITDNVKIDCVGGMATLYRTNLVAFIKHEFPVDVFATDPVLIPERILSAIVNSTIADEITIGYTEASATLSDGNSETTIQCDSPDDFPKFPEVENGVKVSTLSKGVIEAIGVAKKFTDQKLQTNDSFIYLNGRDVFSYYNGILYVKTFETELPKAQISHEAASLINGFDSLNFYSTKNHYFFDSGSTIYGFAKSEYTMRDYSPFMKAEKDQGYSIDPADISVFCDLCLSLSPTGIERPAVMKDGGEEHVELIIDDPYNNIKNNTKLQVDKDFTVPDFTFMPRNLLNLVSSLPYHELTIYPKDGYSLITSRDEGFRGAISQYRP